MKLKAEANNIRIIKMKGLALVKFCSTFPA